jgi:hypothetical protein
MRRGGVRFGSWEVGVTREDDGSEAGVGKGRREGCYREVGDEVGCVLGPTDIVRVTKCKMKKIASHFHQQGSFGVQWNV